MPKADFQIIQKQRNMGAVWRNYVQAKGMLNELIFVNAKEPNEKIYPLFFSEKPKLKVKFIARYAKAAQDAYDALVLEALPRGGTEKQVLKNKIFGELCEHAKAHVTKKLNALAEQFYQSSEYEAYVKTQISASQMASRVRMMPQTGEDLKQAKAAQLLGKKSDAMTFAKSACATQSKFLSKGKAKPKQDTHYSPQDLIRRLEDIKIDI